jgi:hypothetical protein
MPTRPALSGVSQKKRNREAAFGGPDQAEKLDPQPQVCFAFGFLNENPLCPN